MCVVDRCACFVCVVCVHVCCICVWKVVCMYIGMYCICVCVGMCCVYMSYVRVGLGLPSGSGVKNLTCNAGDGGSIPGLGKIPGGGHGNPLQYSCLENPHGQRSLEGYSPWGYKELDMTEATQHIYTRRVACVFMVYMCVCRYVLYVWAVCVCIQVDCVVYVCRCVMHVSVCSYVH